MSKYYPKDPVVNEAIEQIVERANAGMIKYGKSMEEAEGGPLRWVEEATQEAMDAVIYLVKMRRTMQKLAGCEGMKTVIKCDCADCLRRP